MVPSRMPDPPTSTSTRGVDRRTIKDARGTDQTGTDPKSRDTNDKALVQEAPERVPPPAKTTAGAAMDVDAISGGQVPPPAKTIESAAERRLTVWAYRELYFSRDPEWSHTFKISGLKDLIERLEDLDVQHAVSRLAIVAHGNEGGVVRIDGEVTDKPGITLKTVDDYSAQFEQLSTFLTSDGVLEFQSCEAGAGENGSTLLKRLSSFLRPTQRV